MTETNDTVKLCECGCGQPTSLAKRTDNRRGLIQGQPCRYIQGHSQGAATLLERFWDKVDKRGPDDCWEWKGARSADYGNFKFRRSVRHAHRVAYILTFGDIADNLDVCHTCDNPPCCNPAHLFPGTEADNMQDMYRKGRGLSSEKRSAIFRAVVPRGEKQRCAKLTDEKVIEIRQMYATQEYTCAYLGELFGVSDESIRSVVHRKSWTHLP